MSQPQDSILRTELTLKAACGMTWMQRKPDGSRLVRCPERSAVASHRPENHNITLTVSE
jgi:hypothetical protein